MPFLLLERFLVAHPKGNPHCNPVAKSDPLAPLPKLQGDETGCNNGRDRDCRVDPVMRDRICRRPAEVVGNHTYYGCPENSTCRVEEKEAAPRHVADPGHPCRRDPEERDETCDKHGLRSMAV